MSAVKSLFIVGSVPPIPYGVIDLSVPSLTPEQAQELLASRDKRELQSLWCQNVKDQRTAMVLAELVSTDRKKRWSLSTKGFAGAGAAFCSAVMGFHATNHFCSLTDLSCNSVTTDALMFARLFAAVPTLTAFKIRAYEVVFGLLIFDDLIQHALICQIAASEAEPCFKLIVPALLHNTHTYTMSFKCLWKNMQCMHEAMQRNHSLIYCAGFEGPLRFNHVPNAPDSPASL